MTNGDLWAAKAILEALANTKAPWKGKPKMRVRRALRVLTGPLQDLEKERVALLERFGRTDEEGQLQFKDGGEVDLEDREAFETAFRDVLTAEVECEPFSSIRVTDIPMTFEHSLIETDLLVSVGVVTDTDE